MESLNFVIVGHVDHGKSTLIGRLLYDTDSLPSDRLESLKAETPDANGKTEFAHLLDHLEEERLQGVTIDTTQVFFSTRKRRYVIIDAPGHVEFVKNMITGASQAEAAILIIDAKEGVKEQTKRHAYILSLLGLVQVIVVVNKMDLIDYSEDRFLQLRDEINTFLNSISIEPLYFLPVSAKEGDNVAKASANIPWYKGRTLTESLDLLNTKTFRDNKPFIFPVQDIYKIGDKRIATGRIEAGKITPGSQVAVLPSGENTSVKSIEKFMDEPKDASWGESIGLVTKDPVFMERGDILSHPDEIPRFTDTFKANIFWMAKRPFGKELKLTLRLSTQETKVRDISVKRRIDSSTLSFIDGEPGILKNLEVGEVTVRTKRPVAISDFKEIEELGRFILESEGDTVAGGIIKDIENGG